MWSIVLDKPLRCCVGNDNQMLSPCRLSIYIQVWRGQEWPSCMCSLLFSEPKPGTLALYVPAPNIQGYQSEVAYVALWSSYAKAALGFRKCKCHKPALQGAASELEGVLQDSPGQSSYKPPIFRCSWSEAVPWKQEPQAHGVVSSEI